MSRKVIGRSGECNVCAAPCSSCMHMDSKTVEFSDETYRTTQYSATADTLKNKNNKKKKRCDPASSETSHPLSVSVSSNDSFSENADSKPLHAHDDISCVSNTRINLDATSTSDTSLALQLSKKTLNSHTSKDKDVDVTTSSPKEENLFDTSSGGPSKALEEGVSCHKSIAPDKVVPNLQAEVNNDHHEPIGSLKCSGQSEPNRNSNEPEPPLQSASGDETDDSDIVEQDVKVCDICGDAGREDMLAICSRCSDGAEHTYCMRKMLKKIPGSNWMCEECKFAEESNNQKQEVGGKKLSKSSSSTQFSSKRPAENIEVAPAAKRQALETSIGSPKSSSPIKVAALSRESSFKNLDKERSRPAQQVSIGNQSTNDSMEVARSFIAGPRLQTLKGALFKSNSFNASNSKPKIKLVDEVIPQKQKGVKDHTSLEVKERPTRIIGKSMSFKSASLSRSRGSDSKVKMFSPRISHTVDQKGSKPMKERNTFERKSLSKLDRPPIISSSTSTVSTPKADIASRVDSSSLSFATNNRDSKVQTEGKSSTSKATGNLARKTVEVSSTPGGVPSATEQKLNHLIPKDETFPTAEKASNSADGTMPDGLPRLLETPSQTEKLKESSTRPRPSVMSSSRSTFCQKCKEIGHSAEFCRNGSSEPSGIDASAVTARSSWEETHRGSKLKDAIHAALLRKPEIQRRKRTIDQVDEISTLNTDLNPEIACHDQSLVSNKSRNISSAEGTNEGQQAISRISTLDSIHIASNSLMHVVPITDRKSSVVKPTTKDFTNNGLATPPQLAKMSAIPEYEYIWRGCFEVKKSGSFLELYGGIQAHLSTCVSPRVPEVVHNFPQKLSLNEVPRSSAWPMQFCDGGAKEDNIALYFFAKDLESYEKNYKSLLDHMIKNDLALKGNFEGVELLIFPSNQLPENSQRWNMLFFLWGVFRAKKFHCSDSSNKLNVPNVRIMPVNIKACNDFMTMPENPCSPKLIDTESSGCDRSCSELSVDYIDQKPSEALKVNTVPRESSNGSKYATDVDLSEKTRCASSSLREKSPSDYTQQAELKPSSAIAGENSSVIDEKALFDCNNSVGSKEFSSSKEDAGGVFEKKVLDGGVGSSVTVGALDGINREKHEMESNGGVVCVKREAIFGRREQSMEREEYCHQRIESKRPKIDLSDRASDVSSQNITWNGVNNMLADEDNNVGKKRKACESDLYYVDGNFSWRSNPGAVELKQKDLSQCMSVEEKACIEEYECDEKVIPEDIGISTTERRFFPVDSRQGHSPMPWKSSSEERVHDGFPNLELALGAETRPQNKGILPFLVGVGEKKNNQEKPPVDDKEDDVSASLSLSLSFPIQDKEQPAKAVSKPEPLHGERHHVNTSLLFFRSLSEK